MIDWVKEGSKILARPGLSAQEKSLMEAHLSAARLSAQALEARRAPQREFLSLDNTVEALKSEPYNPNVVTDFWATLLTTSDIVQCIYSSVDLKDLAKKDRRGPVYVPDFSYSQLGERFPKMGSWAVAKDSTIKDERETVGWTDTEMVLEAPYRRTTEDQLREKFAKEGRVGARLKTGILASEASKLLVGHFFDEGATWSRYLGSRDGGWVVGADFGSSGDLRVYSGLEPGGARPSLGGRSEGVK